VAARSASTPFFRPSHTFRRFPLVSSTSGTAALAFGGCSTFSTSVKRLSGDAHKEESFEEFTARYARYPMPGREEAKRVSCGLSDILLIQRHWQI
jgi:hypothetical protein